MRRALWLVLSTLSGACAWTEPGLTVRLEALVRDDPRSALRVEHGRLEVTSAELVACPSPFARAWRTLSPISTAWAHGAEEPGGDGALLGASIGLGAGAATPQLLGALSALPGRYCGLSLLLAGLALEGAVAGAPVVRESARVAEASPPLPPFELGPDQIEVTVTLIVDPSRWMSVGAVTAPSGDELFSLAVYHLELERT